MLGVINRFFQKRDLQAFIDLLRTQDAIDIAAMVIIATVYRKNFIYIYGIDVFSPSMTSNDTTFVLRELTSTINREHTFESGEVFVNGLMVLMHTIRCITQPSLKDLGIELWSLMSKGVRYVPILLDDGAILDKLHKQNPALRLDTSGSDHQPIGLSKDMASRMFAKTSHIR